MIAHGYLNRHKNNTGDGSLCCANNPWGISGDQSYEEFLTVFIGETGSNWRLDNCYYLD